MGMFTALPMSPDGFVRPMVEIQMDLFLLGFSFTLKK